MILSRLSPGVWIALFLIFLIAKIAFLISGGGVQFFGLGGSSDADYYAEMAERYGEATVNSWPVFLGALNQYGLYSRVGISYFLFFVSAVVIPFVVIRLGCVDGWVENNRKIWFSIFVAGAYPVLFFYSLDVYRDVFMTLIFLLGCFAIKGVVAKNSPAKLMTWFLIGLLFAFLLYGLRKYLGVAYLFALFYALMCNFKFIGRVQKIRLFYLIVFYFCVVYFGYALDLFDPLMDYRSGFDPVGAGSTFGLQFDSAPLMLPNFLLSWAFQVFGLWPFSGLAIALFFVESLPFIFAFAYVLRNREYINKFGWSLLVFFVAYNTIWVFGNDNLGTAWRLRIYGYISMFIVFLIVYQVKLRVMRRSV